MRIESIICPINIEEKLQSKHGVTSRQAEQVLRNRPRIRFVEKGHIRGNDMYISLGRTFEGRCLSVFFIYKPESRTAIIMSARSMSKKERRIYEQK